MLQFQLPLVRCGKSSRPRDWEGIEACRRRWPRRHRLHATARGQARERSRSTLVQLASNSCPETCRLFPGSGRRLKHFQLGTGRNWRFARPEQATRISFLAASGLSCGQLDQCRARHSWVSHRAAIDAKGQEGSRRTVREKGSTGPKMRAAPREGHTMSVDTAWARPPSFIVSHGTGIPKRLGWHEECNTVTLADVTSTAGCSLRLAVVDSMGERTPLRERGKQK